MRLPSGALEIDGLPVATRAPRRPGHSSIGTFVLGEMRLKPLEVGGVHDHREVVQVLEVLGFDASPSADMWRTIMWPTKYL